MARYQFRLETLRRLRETARDERREKLSEAFRAEQILQERIEEVQVEMGQMQDLQRELMAGETLNTTQLLESQRYQASLEGQQKLMGQQANTLQGEIDRRREALVEADREVKVLDKLDERGQQAHRQEQLRKEVKLLDEVACTRAAGGSRSD